ncbi:S-layer family protein [Leptolyngbya boryana CZ1]|uniref:S-layer family protein n=1 Tax=Leptolyngbya boryana CZ1 TaxID=3060204 RepID=A0AA96WT52_LEPBY|nr:S-layer family protein [Leptolyngbya boryana]WNZ45315.1 S-layer family protein [Leptolyngbya boryana CZ1]
MKCIFQLGLAILGAVAISEKVCPQAVVPDSTLGTVVTGNPNFIITGGTRPNNGANLFHSFSQFSVPTGGSAVFDNALDVQTIFARVTGGSASNIDGLLKANGTASLFLLNPSGILFGANAQLNIGGSFVGTTANSIQFADGTEFSAVNPSSPPLLTMSVPIGLQMGSNAAPIQVEGVPINNFLFRPATLSMAPSQTLALIGGQVDVNSATLFAPDNHVELWAMRNGTVRIPDSGNWQLSSASPSPNWGDITFQNYAYLNTGGATGGPINIRARGLTLQNGSHIESLTGANGRGQGIVVQTTEFVNLLGVSQAVNMVPPGLATSITGSGATAGDITIDTPQLRATTGAWVTSINWGADLITFVPINNAKTGSITIRATDIEVGGYTPSPHPLTGIQVASAITTIVSGGQQNNSGAITVTADQVRLLDGGRISTDLLGNPFFSPAPTTGKAGDISVTATRSLEIRGNSPNDFTSAIISSIQNFVDGQGGNITINTGQLALAQGGTISSAISGNPIPVLAGRGTAGNITIQATDVQVSDFVFEPFSKTSSGITVALGQNGAGQGGNINLNANSLRVFNGGQITSSSEGNGPAGNVNLNVNTLDVQGSSPTLVDGQYSPSAISASSASAFTAGSVNISTDSLSVRDGANITVSNIGTGDAGNLNIAAGTIFLNNGASLQAEVNGGSQGNIGLQARDLLLLRQGSKIVTSASGTSTGGNITIDAPIIVGLEDSDIVANAVQGKGGNILITTQGIIGLQYRDRQTPENDITASSEFGVNGTVEVNNVGVDPNSGLVQLSTTLIDSDQKVAAACSGTQGSSFVITGRGGIPQNPTQNVSHDRSWNDMRDLSAFHKPAIAPAQTAKLVEATAWSRNPQTGKVELVAAHPTSSTPSAICASKLNLTQSHI